MCALCVCAHCLSCAQAARTQLLEEVGESAHAFEEAAADLGSAEVCPIHWCVRAQPLQALEQLTPGVKINLDQTRSGSEGQQRLAVSIPGSHWTETIYSKRDTGSLLEAHC